MNDYKPISCDHYDFLESLATQGKYCKIQYFTDLQEFITTRTLFKNFVTVESQEFAILLTGEQVRLDKIIAIDGILSPHFQDFKDKSCDF
jgi:Rho-binding antiterminator